jgi:hypothetical protein
LVELVRFLVKFQKLLGYAPQATTEAKSFFLTHAQNMLVWLAKERNKFHKQVDDYIPADESYQKLVKKMAGKSVQTFF